MEILTLEGEYAYTEWIKVGGLEFRIGVDIETLKQRNYVDFPETSPRHPQDRP